MEIKNLEKRKKDVRDNIDQLEVKKVNLNIYIKEADSKLIKLKEKKSKIIQELDDKIKYLKEIEETGKNLQKKIQKGKIITKNVNKKWKNLKSQKEILK